MTQAYGKVRQASPALLWTAALLACAASSPGTASSPDSQVRRGERIAQNRCSACHVVAENQEYPVLLKEPAPGFQSIANRPETSEKALRHFVATTHWDLKTVPITMPDPELTKAESAAVIRYILSLKNSPGHG